jgi:5-methylcytosine-specific restriction endonuclease McrA
MTDFGWKDFIQKLVVDYCNEQGSRTFTLQDFQSSKELDIQSFSPENKHPFDKVRQQLQVLRKEGVLSFVDNRGTYTLRNPAVLEDELLDKGIALISQDKPDKQEYLRETYARDRGWVKKAKDNLGMYCLHPECKNTFNKEDGLPYIEVHHIIPLFEGGEDGIWNLAVVCAHHHKMAHFADKRTKQEIRDIFLSAVDTYLKDLKI